MEVRLRPGEPSRPYQERFVPMTKRVTKVEELWNVATGTPERPPPLIESFASAFPASDETVLRLDAA
jgi:hypothetical protein